MSNLETMFLLRIFLKIFDNEFISKLLPYLAVINSHLPKVLCIDEFKGNSSNYKYQVALLDGETYEMVDILECGHKNFLYGYLNFVKNN